MTLSPTFSLPDLRAQIVGIDAPVPLRDGSLRPYINFDNAASTPVFQGALDKVNQLMQYYASIHRGAGFKSLVSTHAYERAREIVAQFVGADPQTDVVIFGKNTTEATNTLAAVTPWQPDDVVICSIMEHHSNDLPWRPFARVVYVGVDADGQLDLADYERKLRQHAGHVRLVTVTGASNVTGFLPPIYEMAALAHQYGTRILVDCAQLAPHRAICKGPAGQPQTLDFITLSAHKLYAPYGTGALIGPKDYFSQRPPQMRGGGTIELVTHDEVHWSEAPDRNEAGSPNVAGAVAMAASLRILSAVGMAALAEHEKELTRYILTHLQSVDGLRVLGSADPDRLEDRLGVIAFNLPGLHHSQVAAILAYEGGIGVRNGCFCAHPYILELLKVPGDQVAEVRGQILSGDRSAVPGLVRASFGCYNTTAEIDVLVEWLQRIRCGDYVGKYVSQPATGSYVPVDWDPAPVAAAFDL